MSKFSKEKESSIIEDYKKGLNTVEIAKKWNTYNTSIRRVLMRYNIPLRSTQKVQRLCKHNPFKSNDELSDYFLGLLLTDGSISKKSGTKYTYSISLGLNERDGYIVEKFRDFVSPSLKVSKVLQKINSSYMYSVVFVNDDAECWLRRKGNFYNKSYNCKIYTPINWNILRGIFDGDGGFHPNSGHLDFFICGRSLDFIKQIKYFLDKYNITSYIRERTNNYGNKLYYIEVYKIKDVLFIGSMLYFNACIFIKRKYNKWLSFYENRSV